MRYTLLILLFTSFFLRAQDKVFFKDGSFKKGVIISMGNDFIFFKTSDTSLTSQKIARTDLLLVERYNGKIFIFAASEKPTADTSLKNKLFYRNSFGLLPLNFLTGRITVLYERLNKTGRIGVVIPLSLAFDPVGPIYTLKNDSNNFAAGHKKGINFIGGADLNFYLGKGDFEGFFIGPRVRYGTDMFLGIEGYSVQTQFGWRSGQGDEKVSQHVSVGIGFVRILASSAGSLIDPKQSYGWFSINYRLSVNW